MKADKESSGVVQLGDKLRQIREEEDMSLRDAEEATRDDDSGKRVSRTTISLLEQGKTKPHHVTLRRLARAYGDGDNYSPKTIMALWRLELAQAGKSPDAEGADRFIFLKWMLNRDGSLAHAETDDERLDLIDMFIAKEDFEARRRWLLNKRAQVESGEYKPSRFFGRREDYEQLQEQHLAELEKAYV